MYVLNDYYEWTDQLSKMQAKLTSDISKLYTAIIKQADNYSHSEYSSLIRALKEAKKASANCKELLEFAVEADIILYIPK